MRLWVSAIVASVCLATASALAQGGASAGRLNGTIRDADGAALPGVVVTLTGKRTATTDKDGKFEFPILPLGDLELRARLVGFRTVVWTVTIAEKTDPMQIRMRPATQFQIIFVGDTPGDIRRRR